ncbi:MAG: hypothetical protein LBC50_01745 [Candidatus Ancillula sp.]|jgi:DNA polymerase-3 subunit epsilon|nr:hypothetical protein [Candidatus Ancillula sp.]
MKMLGFDTETTGLDLKNDRIVEVAFTRKNTEKSSVREAVIDVDQWVVNPGIKIPEFVSNIHGITDERAQIEGVNAAESAEKCAQIITEAASEGRACVIYNAGYDLGILKYELLRYSLPDISERLGRKFIEIVDPLILDRILDPYRSGSRKLKDVATHYNVSAFGEYHHASVDAMITTEIATKMFLLYDIIGEMNYEELYEFQNEGMRRHVQQRNIWAKKNGKPLHRAKWISVSI